MQEKFFKYTPSEVGKMWELMGALDTRGGLEGCRSAQ